MAKPTALDLDIYRGDTFQQELLMDEDEDDISGYTFVAEIREFKADDDPIVAFTVDTTSADDGLVTIQIDPEDTDTLPTEGYWDIQMTSDTASPVTTTVYAGRVYVTTDVTD